MEGAEAVSTRVEYASEGVRGEIPHGLGKNWEAIGRTGTFAVTLPVDLARAARTAGYNFSAVLRESLLKLVAGGAEVEIARQLEFHRQQVSILETASKEIDRRRAEAESAAAEESARQEAVRAIAGEFARASVGSMFRSAPRSSLGKSRVNLNWIAARARHFPALKSLRPEQILELVLSATPSEART